MIYLNKNIFVFIYLFLQCLSPDPQLLLIHKRSQQVTTKICFLSTCKTPKGVFLNLATTIPLLCIRLWRHAERWPPPTAPDATVHFRRKKMTPFDCER